MNRRSLFQVACLAGTSGWLRATAIEPKRIQDLILAFSDQGFHRTGTAVDLASGQWLASEAARRGLRPILERFSLSRVDPIASTLSLEGHSLAGLPLFDAAFTDAQGIEGRLGPAESDASIGVMEAPAYAYPGDPLDAVRRQRRHRALVAITRGGRPGLCPRNAEDFLNPFGPPALQLSSEQADALLDAARRGAPARLVVHVRRTRAESFNVVVRLPGGDRSASPVVVLTPRSGWWNCASERGGGLVCWLETMGALKGKKLRRDLLFVATSGHEIGQLGIQEFARKRRDIYRRSHAWIHLGANIGAVGGVGNSVQASSDAFEQMLASRIEAAGMTIYRRVPRGAMPAGEAGAIHRGGGRYLSAIGSNPLFHHLEDRGTASVDAPTIARFIDVFVDLAAELASK